MKITSNNVKNLLTWADVNVNDDNGNRVQNPIRKITLTIEAGDLAILDIEEYTIDNMSGTVLQYPTVTNRYYVDKIEISTKYENKYDALNQADVNEKEIYKSKQKRLSNISAIFELEL